MFKSDKETDGDILEAILRSLKGNTTIPDKQISVTVDQGIVTLVGTVEWEYQRIQAKSAIEKLAGVRSVINLITIRPVCTSSDIYKKIDEAFHQSATVDAKKIKVEIVGTKVILRGVVRSLAEKEDAENAAMLVPGIKCVESILEIEEPVCEDEGSETGKAATD
jgi:osmotically-inducible protein OsmY